MADNESDRYEGKYSDVPILDSDGVTFVNWKIKTNIWCEGETSIESEKKVGKILLKLPDRAFDYVKDIPKEDLNTKEGVKVLLDKLEELYIPDKLQERIRVHKKLYNMRRKDNGCVIKHIEEYMKLFRRYRTLCEKSDYDDSDLALEIMGSCDLSEQDTKTVSAQMNEPPSSTNIIQILKRIFSMANQEKYNKDKNDSDIFLDKAAQIKQHDNNFGDDEDSHCTFYERGSNRKMSRPWNRNKRQNPWDKPWDKNRRGQIKNRVGSDGRVMTCTFCDSQWHFMDDCDEMAKLKKEHAETT